jgi:hypothetical protein
MALRFWPLPVMIAAAVAWAIYIVFVARTDIEKFSPWSPNFDPQKVLVSPFFATMFLGIFGLTNVLFISAAHALYRETNRLWIEACHRIVRLAKISEEVALTKEINASSWYCYLYLLSDRYFKDLTQPAVIFTDQSGSGSDGDSDDEYCGTECSRHLIKLEVEGYQLHTKLFPGNLDVDRAFAELFNSLLLLKSIHETKTPPQLHRIAASGLILLHAITIPFYWAHYGWIVGSIFIVVIVGFLTYMVDLQDSLGSIFESRSYYHYRVLEWHRWTDRQLISLVPEDSTDEDEQEAKKEVAIPIKAPRAKLKKK